MPTEIHQWQNNNYLTDKDTFNEIQAWLGHFWKHIRYMCYFDKLSEPLERMDVLDSGFYIKPVAGTGSLAASATNVNILIQELRVHISQIDQLNLDSFLTDTANQPLHYDKSLILQAAFRNVEKNLLINLIRVFGPLSTAINTFFNTFTGQTLKEYWSESGADKMFLNFENISWDPEFINFWYQCFNEDLVRPIATIKNTSGTWTDVASASNNMKLSAVSLINVSDRGETSYPDIDISGAIFVSSYSPYVTAGKTFTSTVTLNATSNKIALLGSTTDRYVGVHSISAVGGNTDQQLDFLNR